MEKNGDLKPTSLEPSRMFKSLMPQKVSPQDLMLSQLSLWGIIIWILEGHSLSLDTKEKMAMSQKEKPTKTASFGSIVPFTKPVFWGTRYFWPTATYENMLKRGDSTKLESRSLDLGFPPQDVMLRKLENGYVDVAYRVSEMWRPARSAFLKRGPHSWPSPTWEPNSAQTNRARSMSRSVERPSFASFPLVWLACWWTLAL